MYALLALSIFSASMYSIILHRFPADKNGNLFCLNFYSSIIWIILLFAANRFSVDLDSSVLIWGVVYGVVQALFVWFKAKAMHSGSVPVTTLIGNSSLIISILFSFFVWREPITFIDGIALVLFLSGIFLATYQKSSAKHNKSWKYYAVFFLLFASAIGIVFKAFGKSPSASKAGSMMLISAVVMTVLYFFFSLVTRSDKSAISRKSFILFILSAGIFSCLYNRLNIVISASLDAVVFFPAFNGGVVVVSAILSKYIDKEKLSKRQITGLALSVLAIIMIGVF